MTSGVAFRYDSIEPQTSRDLGYSWKMALLPRPMDFMYVYV